MIFDICSSKSILINSIPFIISSLSTDAAKDFFLRLFLTDLGFRSLMPLGLTLLQATINPSDKWKL